ncbi:hypothetical protein GGI07_002792 [Coemansia sp. Benny D115]|nr:hypothetical protein GGI07_002792 [Coemansia sp. Benny D115]
MSGSTRSLRILHFNDVYHVSAGEREPVGGAARFGTLLHSLQESAGRPPALTLFSGDAYFPSLESSISRGEHMLPVLNELKIDASTFGNHEFDQGIDRLEDLISRNNFPWIITNLTDRETGGPAARNGVKYLVKEIDGLRVGIIGIVEKEWLDTLPCLPPTFEYQEFVQAARDMAVRLRDRDDEEMRCDLVVCLSHMRLPNDIKLADSCADVIDLVLSGHDHFYYIGSGVDEFTDPSYDLIVQNPSATVDDDDERMVDAWKKERAELSAGTRGRRLIKSGTDFRDLSEITLELSFAADDKSKLDVSKLSVTRHRVTKDIAENSEIKTMVDKIESHLSKALDKVIGFTTEPWDARSTVCRTQESNIGSLSADLMRSCYAESAGAQIGFLCGGAIRSDNVYPEGRVRLKEIMEIFPFEDPIVVVKLTGDQVRRALENGVSKWPAQEGRFPQVSGIRFEFDPTREPGDRVTSVVLTASAKAAAKRSQIQSDSSSLPRIRQSVSSKSGSIHRMALQNTLHNSSSQTFLGKRRGSTASDSISLAESESDVESDYGGEEDEPLDMNAEYVVATRDYMYQGHDGYEALNEGELIVDEENGITFADLYRRFFRGLAVTNALRFRKYGYAGSCSLARQGSPMEQSGSNCSGGSEWKRLIIKHADDLKALARKQEQEKQEQAAREQTKASKIAAILQQYNESLASKAQFLTHHGSNIIKALLSSGKRLSAEQEPMRVARSALFGRDDTSAMPLSEPSTPVTDQNDAPRNDDAGAQHIDTRLSQDALATVVARVVHDGDVQCIVAPSNGIVATASSYGTISIYGVALDSKTNDALKLRESVTAHRFVNDEPAVATALAVQPVGSVDAEIASCGEDGNISYVSVARLDALQSYEVDSTVLTGVCWPTPAQVAVSTRGGQIKLFDRRSPAEVASVFVDSSGNYAFECIAAHPSQSFRLATGTDTGSVLLWDVRNPRKPVTEAFNVHEGNVWQVKFDPINTGRIVSCSEDASIAVTQWDSQSGGSAVALGMGADKNRGVRKLSSMFNVLSVNCLDVCPYTRTSVLVAGSDSGNLLLEKTSGDGFSLF